MTGAARIVSRRRVSAKRGRAETEAMIKWRERLPRIAEAEWRNPHAAPRRFRPGQGSHDPDFDRIEYHRFHDAVRRFHMALLRHRDRIRNQVEETEDLMHWEKRRRTNDGKRKERDRAAELV